MSPSNTSRSIGSVRLVGGVGLAQASNSAFEYKLVRVTLLGCINLFLISCIFDPADLLFGLKVPLFCACWMLFSLLYLLQPTKYRVPLGLVVYVALMIGIPVLSIAYYFATNGREPYEGFALGKAYFLISFSLLLYLLKVDLVRAASRILTLGALVILVTYLLMQIDPSLVESIRLFGSKYGMIQLDNRAYSPELMLLSVLFVTSPMLGLPIAYYTYLALKSRRGAALTSGLMAIINIIAMFLAGTRNNMLTAILLPAAVMILCSRRKLFMVGLTLPVLAAAVASYAGEIAVMLNPAEASNDFKLTLVKDYGQLFSDPVVLLFGQGLGSYHYWTAKGSEFFISELTYLEIIRSFGIFLGAVMIALMFYPVYYWLRQKRRYPQAHIMLAYAFYLGACITNPLFFSSMGLLLLSIVLANIFMHQQLKSTGHRQT